MDLEKQLQSAEIKELKKTIKEMGIENEVLKIRNKWLEEQNEYLHKQHKIGIDLMHRTLEIYKKGHIEIQAELNVAKAMKL
jgi:hypothetical protein